jgi:hypothetical protein
MTRFRLVVPFEGARGLPDILNAAWQVFDTPDFWKGRKEIRIKRNQILKDLTLKNIEIFELEQRKGAIS